MEYQEEFYDDLCNYERMCHSGHKLYTMVAVIPKERNKESIATNTTSDVMNGDNKNHDHDNDEQITDTSDEQIIACLVGCVLTAHKLNHESRQLLVPDWPHSHGKLFYIMTLGTVTAYRHFGLATRLVEQVLETMVHRDVDMGTVYLHVITSNDAAIRFYETKLGFWRVQEIADYYTIEGEQYNCYLYARYFHGNRGHLDLFKVVSRWVSTLWSSISQILQRRGYFPHEQRIR